MKKIRLWEHAGTGLIIPAKTGVILTNQTGGHSCLHPELEGAFVPLWNEVGTAPKHDLRSKENDLFAYFTGSKHGGAGAVDGLDQSDAEFIDKLFLDYSFLFKIHVDRNKLNESHEAWVHVLVGLPEALPNGQTIIPLFEGFGNFPIEAVLTWANSD